MVVTLPKIGTGTEDDPIRPDTNAPHWQILEERDTEFVVEILEDQTGGQS